MLIGAVIIATLFVSIVIILIAYKMVDKGVHIWGKEYISIAISRYINPEHVDGVKHVMFMFTDHFEPRWRKPTLEIERQRVDDWVEKYPNMASKYRDSDGKPPQHTWFYHFNGYRAEHLYKLAALCYQGFGEIELHLHHNYDTSEGVEDKLNRCKELFAQHGALITCEEKPKLTYGFIHGMFALDNSSPKHCGVNNELQILKRTGCYADFTFPTTSRRCQPKKINSIYYATDDPDKPKSYNTGVDVRKGMTGKGDLMIIQGALIINLRHWPNGLYPYLDTGIITYDILPVKQRIDLWIKKGVYIKGKPEWIFVKVYSHGTQEKTRDILLGEPIENMHAYLLEKYNDGVKYQLHYVTAREAYNIIKAAEAGMEGNPDEYRDYVIKPYVNTKIYANVLYRLQSYTQYSVDINVMEDKLVKFEFKEHVIKSINGYISHVKFDMKHEEGIILLDVTGSGKIKVVFKLAQGITIHKHDDISLMSEEVDDGIRYVLDMNVQQKKMVKMKYV